jgi:hypothetical protein
MTTITWSLAYGCGKQQINGDKIYSSNAGNFDGHAHTAVQCGVHCPMECIRGFMQSH